jgi:hypothetical protein
MNRQERIDDFEGALLAAMAGRLASVWTALPGEVVGVDLSAQTVSIQPTIQGKVTSADGAESDVSLPVLVDVPIVWPRAGGFALTFPIAVGDEVLVVFSSRCIDSWWQSGGVGVQAEKRTHDLSDGFAILAPTSQPKKLSAVSSSNAQLRDEAGTTYLEITPNGRINITAAAEINATAPVINFTATTEINATAPVINFDATSAMTIAAVALNIVARIDATGGQTFDGIIFAAHEHLKGAPTDPKTEGPSNP